MKKWLAIGLCLISAAVQAAESAVQALPSSDKVKGEVQEVLEASGFTYMRLKTKEGEYWTSVPKTAIAKGATVDVENIMAMRDFRSNSLNRTFPLLLLGNLAGKAAANPHGSGGAVNPHNGMVQAPPPAVDIKVSRATDANARTVAEVVTKSAELKDRPVSVRGRIVRYNEGIMGRNWIHLRDGSGTDADYSNDVLVRTTQAAKVGDIVTADGTVRTDQDFGSGYAYKVLIEDAKLRK